MTIVAWDGTYLAADVTVTYGNGDNTWETPLAQKLYRVQNSELTIDNCRVVGFAIIGTMAPAHVSLHALLKHKGELSEFIKAGTLDNQLCNPGFQLIFVTNKPSGYHFGFKSKEGKHYPKITKIQLTSDEPVKIYGSGSTMARLLDRSSITDARDACMIAAAFVKSCGGSIEFINALESDAIMVHPRMTTTGASSLLGTVQQLINGDFSKEI